MRSVFKKGLYKGIDAVGLNRSYLQRQHHIVLILTYHSVIPYSEKYKRFDYRNCVTDENFDKQIRFLKQNYNVVTMDEAVEAIREKNINERLAVITFDDGFRNNYLYALPVLKKNNVSAVFYLATSFIGKKETLWTETVNHLLTATGERSIELEMNGAARRFNLTGPAQKEKASIEIRNYLKFSSAEVEEDILNQLQEKIKDVSDPVSFDPDRYAFMSWSDVNEMEKSGMEIGSHTHSHFTLNMLDKKSSFKDIGDSKKQIEEHTDHTCKHFSYPNGEKGNFLPHHFEQLKETGFDSAVTQIKGLNSYSDNLFALKRINISAKMGMEVFKSYCSGTYALIH